jgi:hypothetical protein
LVTSNHLPLEILDVHFLTAAVVYTTEYINVVVVELSVVEESSKGHG